MIGQEQMKYGMIVDIGDDLLENVDLSLDRIRVMLIMILQNIKDDKTMDQIKEDVKNSMIVNRSESINKP